jgi:hypothetical protein
MVETKLNKLLNFQSYDTSRNIISLFYQGIGLRELFSAFATECHNDWPKFFSELNLISQLAEVEGIAVSNMKELEQTKVLINDLYHFSMNVRDIFQNTNAGRIKLNSFSFTGLTPKNGSSSDSTLFAYMGNPDECYLQFSENIKRGPLEAFLTRETMDKYFPQKEDSRLTYSERILL